MKYQLIKRGEVVGEAVVLSDGLVYYHLWKNITLTHECSLSELKKKFKLQQKED